MFKPKRRIVAWTSLTRPADVDNSTHDVHATHASRGFRGSTSSDNCVLTFRSQACLTISVEEKARGRSSPWTMAYPGVFLIVTQVSCSNFIHLTHCAGLKKKCRISLRSFSVLVLTSTTRLGEDQTNCTSLYWTFADL